MPGDLTVVSGADLNDIPAALVDHVEVLTGGASAVYGSDALAGVVNFVMRKDFEGIEVDGTTSITQNDNTNSRWRAATQTEINGGAFGFSQTKQDSWDGGTDDATLIMGTNTANDKGNVTAYLSFRNVQPVVGYNRDYAECTISNSSTGKVCGGSSNFNRWLSYDNLFHDISSGFANPTAFDYFEHGTGKSGSGSFVPYSGANASQHFNYGALNYSQRPDTRYTGGFFAHYQENKELDIYSSFMFADDHTVAQIAPSGLFLGSGTEFSNTIYTNCGNPLMTPTENFDLCGQLPNDGKTTVIGSNGKPFTYYNGAGNGATGDPGGLPGFANLEVGRRDIEGGDRQADLRHTAYRMDIGARGDLGDGWTYDVYAQYGLTLFTETYLNEFSKNRVQQALLVDPTTGKCFGNENLGGNPGAGTPGCVPLDIFNGLGSITPAMLNFVKTPGLQNGFTQEQIVSGSITGDLGEWGGQSPWAKNPIAISVGAEYRDEQLQLNTDQEFTTNDLYGQGSATFSVPRSGFDVSEGFTEVKVPLVQGVPWVEDLTLNAGYRYSSYNTAGSTNTYKYGAEWQPIDDFRLRGSVERAVRAPNVLELFAPTNVVLFSGNDPCRNTTAGNCAHVPNAGNSAVLSCPATQCNQQVGGNTLLKPEVSDTHTGGIVFTPTFIDGFTATVDWFNIKVDNYINLLLPNETLTECYGPSATATTEAFYCPLVHRSGSGQIWGAGYVAAPTVNTGWLQTKGVDFELNYQTDLATWGVENVGSLASNFTGTYLDTFLTEPVPQVALLRSIQTPYDCAGLYGQTCLTPAPKWRFKWRLTWTTPWDVDISAAWRYVGAVALDADTSDAGVGGGPGVVTCPNGDKISGVGDCLNAKIASYDYFDLSADWNVREGIDLRAGVENIFDIEPPVVSLSQCPTGPCNNNSWPGVYDVLGRTLFVAATIKY
jgi:iron complex outermembrane receptor protein